jgi:RNA polymerase sigma-70 factor, ECF subfamily
MQSAEESVMALSPPDGTMNSYTAVAFKDQADSSKLENEVLALFDQYRNRLLRYVLALGLTIHDSEEIVQEVFLSLFRHMQRGRPGQNLAGWLFRVAHNLALKQRSANQRLRDVMDSDDRRTPEKSDSSLNPEEAVIDRQRRERLLAVVRALPEQDQLCLRLRAEGLRYREIAETLGISLGWVSNSLTRALARLTRVDGR